MKKKACVLVGVKKASASDESILLLVNSETALLVLQLLQKIKRMAKTKGYDHLVEEISWAQEEILDWLLVDREDVIHVAIVTEDKAYGEN